MPVPMPDNENARLLALQQCAILDTPPEPGFDDITLLASQLCGTPIAAVSLIDEHRQWFKSSVGLAVTETPRDAAFCAYAILQDSLLLVPDAREDSRFANNPLVTGEPYIRFYAGAPLINASGHVLGSLCVIDRIPRTLTVEQKTALLALSRQVVTLLELRRSVTEREQAQIELQQIAERFQTAVEAMGEGLVVQDAQGAIQVCNSAAEQILGLTADQLRGRTSFDPRWHAIREDGTDFPGSEHPVTLSLRDGRSFRGVIMGVFRADGTLVWISVNSSPLFHPGAEKSYAAVATFTDITARKQAADADARLAAIVDSSADAIVGATLEGTVVSWNAAAERLYGRSATEMLGRNCTSLAGPGQVSPVPAVLARFKRGEEVLPMEVARQRPDGTWVDIWLTFSRINNAQGEMVGLAAIGSDITARKQAETALRRSEERLTVAQQVAQIGNFEFDVATGEISWSEEMFRLLGFDPALGEPTFENFTAHYHPDDLVWHKEIVQKALTDGTPYEFDIRVAQKDGTYGWVHAIGKVARNAQGQVCRLFGTVMDVTERKLMERALQESQEFAESVAQQSTSIIFVFDLDRMANVYSNRSVGDFLGYSAEQVAAMGDNLLPAMLHPEDLPHVLAHFTQFAGKADSEVVEIEYRARHVSGEWRWIWSREVVFKRHADGTPAQIMGTAQDITERKQTERALRLAEANYRGLFENAVEGIFQTTPAGRLLRANPAMARMLGYDSVQDILESLTDISHQLYVHPEDRERFRQAMREQDKLQGLEVPFHRKDGSTLWVKMNSNAVCDASGQVLHFEGTLEDITQQHEAELRLRDYHVILEFQKEELERANAELEMLATTDGLTGLKNRRSFQETLTQEFRRVTRYQPPLSLIILDVDHFKEYNDAFGHPAGDTVLQSLAQILVTGARGTDLAARYGGEEFALILPHTNGQGACIIAERLRAAIETYPWPLRPITVSIGICTLVPDIADPEMMVARADQALYHSKAAGRNRVTHAKTLREVAVG